MNDQPALGGLAASLQALFTARGLTLATAESCTGGLIGHVLTEIPGSSDYYLGGVISYSDRIKEHQLGVEAHVLDASTRTFRRTALGVPKEVT